MSSSAIDRYVAFGDTTRGGDCAASLRAGFAWARAQEGLDVPARSTRANDPEELERALLRIAQRGRLGSGDLWHVEIHGSGPSAWGLWFDGLVFAPQRVLAEPLGLAPGLALVGSCWAATASAMEALAWILAPGTPVIACEKKAYTDDLTTRVFPALDAADVLNRGAPPPASQRWLELDKALRKVPEKKRFPWRLLQVPEAR